MAENEDKKEKKEEEKKNKEQEFIVETPLEIEEHIIGSDKIIKYERGKFLGKGGFAKCYEMKRVDTGKIFAAKVFDKKGLSNGRSRKKLINEIKLHKKLHHLNIVNFEHFFEDKSKVKDINNILFHTVTLKKGDGGYMPLASGEFIILPETSSFIENYWIDSKGRVKAKEVGEEAIDADEIYEECGALHHELLHFMNIIC